MSLPITSLRNGWPTNHRIKYDRTCGAPHKKHGISTPILHHLVMLGGIVASVCLAQPFACSTPALALTHVMLGHFVCLRGGEYHPSEHRTLAPCCHGCCSSGCGWHPSRGHLLCAALRCAGFCSGWNGHATADRWTFAATILIGLVIQSGILRGVLGTHHSCRL
jgi:hypothetical protein